MIEEGQMGSRSNGALGDSPSHLFHRVAQCIKEIFDAEQRNLSLTPRQTSVLSTIAQNEGLSQNELVDLTGVDRSTIADIVRRLHKKGLVQRRRTREDARAYAVKLTDEGWQMVRAAGPLMERVDERVLRPLGVKERAKLIASLKAIVGALQPSEGM
jgi:MarR family transcriptional regulator, temperature-dependent positive regulator of motility